MSDYARGERLVRLREDKGLTQEQAASEMGTTAKSLRGWEHGAAWRRQSAKLCGAFYEVDWRDLNRTNGELEGAPSDGVTSELRRLEQMEPKVEQLLEVSAAVAESLQRLSQSVATLEQLLRVRGLPPAAEDAS